MKGWFPKPQPLRPKLEIFLWKKDLLFLLGIGRAKYLHSDCPPNLISHYSHSSDECVCVSKKKESIIFVTIPAIYWANWSSWLFYQILKLRACGWQGVCAHDCTCSHRGPLGYLKLLKWQLFIYMAVWAAGGGQRQPQELVLSFHHVSPETCLTCWTILLGPSWLFFNQKLRAYCFKINLCPDRLWALISQWKLSFKNVRVNYQKPLWKQVNNKNTALCTEPSKWWKVLNICTPFPSEGHSLQAFLGKNKIRQ